MGTTETDVEDATLKEIEIQVGGYISVPLMLSSNLHCYHCAGQPYCCTELFSECPEPSLDTSNSLLAASGSFFHTFRSFLGTLQVF